MGMKEDLKALSGDDKSYLWNYFSRSVKNKYKEYFSRRGVSEITLSDGSTLTFSTYWTPHLRCKLWKSSLRLDSQIHNLNDGMEVIASCAELDEFKHVKRYIESGKWKENKKKKVQSEKARQSAQEKSRAEVFNCKAHSQIARTVILDLLNRTLKPSGFKLDRWAVYKSRGGANISDFLSSGGKSTYLLGISSKCSKSLADTTGEKLYKEIKALGDEVWESLATSSCEDSRRLYVAFSDNAEALGALDTSKKVRLMAKSKIDKDE